MTLSLSLTLTLTLTRHVSAPKRINALKDRRVCAIAAGYESSLALSHDGTVP